VINSVDVSRLRRPRNRAGRTADRQYESVLRISEKTIRAVAQRRGPKCSLTSICVKYAIAAAKIRWKRIVFRENRNHLACAAYSRMQLAEFQAVNARQAWANWRTIPRNLAGRLPLRPLFVLDLCCGIGESTEVLAYYCAPGSLILGLEFNRAFVAAARARRYSDRSGQPADVGFVAQNVLETFRDGSGQPIAPNSVDLINASGAIGCHFDGDATAILARQCARVLKDGGLALIDAGREGTCARELVRLFAEQGFQPVHKARSCVFDRYWQLCLQKGC
jgi:SAM-dependent methyltransferase